MTLFLTESPSYHNPGFWNRGYNIFMIGLRATKPSPNERREVADDRIPIAVVKCRCANVSGTSVSCVGWRRGRVGCREVVR